VNDGEATKEMALRTGPKGGEHGFLRVQRSRQGAGGQDTLAKVEVPILAGRQRVGVVASGGRVGHGKNWKE